MKKIRNTKFFMLNGILTLLLFVVLMLLLVTVVPYKVANADSSSNVIDEKSTMTQQDDIIYNASGWIPETLQIKLSVPLLSIADESVSTTEKVVDYTNAFPTPGN